MRRIVNSTFITLDGVIEHAGDWPPASDVEDDTSFGMHTELLLGSDAVLMGRRTYEGFAPAWSSRSGDPFSDRINAMPKIVVSSTLTDPEWANTTVIAGDPIPEIRRRKEEPGRDFVQYGFGRLSYALMENGLLDELRLWVHPFFLGRGGPQDLMYRDTRFARFTLAEARPLQSGVVLLTYHAAV